MSINLIPAPKELHTDFKLFFREKLSDFVTVHYDAQCASEEYYLTIDEKGADIRCADRQAEFYARRTLKQLEYGYPGNIPYMTIHDKPEFSYRGFMIDCARHFFSVDDLKKMIDAASLFKFNKFHWHLTDDQGWRIEIEKYPLLTKKGGTRPFSHFGRVFEQGPYEGFYTKKQIREIIDYCANRGIDVIPEIEIPGHSSAMLAAYPHLSCTGNPVEVKTSAGIYPDIQCAGKEQTYKFLFDVIDEISALFPSRYIHIGGDEAPKKQWEKCPDCNNAIKEFALSGYAALQGHMLNKVYEYVNKKGREVITWNESLRGDNLEKGIIIQNWREKDDECAIRANTGGKVIVSDFFHYYLDYPHGMTSLKKTYMYNPISEKIGKDSTKNIMGVETPVWTEHIRDVLHMSKMCYPRIMAVAETGWCGVHNKNYDDFLQRLDKVLPMIEQYGLTYTKKEDRDPEFFKAISQVVKFFINSINRQTIKTLKNSR